tara:strand:+ start:696 stop:1055 length:360 start_codon:yes stop_codon:yes gene_type:complete
MSGSDRGGLYTVMFYRGGTTTLNKAMVVLPDNLRQLFLRRATPESRKIIDAAAMAALHKQGINANQIDSCEWLRSWPMPEDPLADGPRAGLDNPSPDEVQRMLGELHEEGSIPYSHEQD